MINHPNTRTWVNYIKDRVINKNQNFLGFLVGGCGTGKSEGALELAYLMDTTFNINRVAFTPKDFLTLIHSEIPKGSVIMYDEAGVGISSRKWQSATNSLVNYTLQTFRYKNLIVLFTVPYLDFIDKQSRSLIDGYFETKHIDRKRSISQIKARLLQVNRFSGKIYQHRLEYRTKEGIYKIGSIYLKRPPKELREQYDKKKKEFLDKLYGNMIEQFGNMGEPGKTLSPVQEKVYNYRKEHPTATQAQTATALNMHISNVNQAIRGARKKGYK